MSFLLAEQLKEYLKLLQWSCKYLLQLYPDMTQIIICF